MRELKSPADRTKARRIRKEIEEGEEIDDDDRAWLEHYERTQRGGTVGKSASKKLIHIEEEAAAEGDHPHPDAYLAQAAMARADGMRADTLFRLQSEAWQQLNTTMFELIKFVMSQMTQDRAVTASLLEAVRGHYLSRTQTEAEMMRMQALADLKGEDDDEDELIKVLALLGKARAAAGKEAPAEKAKKAKKVKPLGAVDQG